jgi:hypothetical protein
LIGAADVPQRPLAAGAGAAPQPGEFMFIGDGLPGVAGAAAVDDWGIHSRAMGRVPLILVAALVCSCGSSSTSPTPVPPSLVGNWSGGLTITITAVDSGRPQSVRCGFDWSVVSQTNGFFSGTWTLSRPADVPPPICAPSTGAVTGSISANAALTDMSFERLLDLNPECIRLSGSGQMSGTATPVSINAERRQRVQCPSATPPVVDLVEAVSLTKR